MAVLQYEIWDVFTDTIFSGNQLAVIMDANNLTTEQMQAITREFNYAESTFVMTPEEAAHTARVRIFTPGYEMPFAGHPTVGTALAIARAKGLDHSVTLELNAGIFPVDVRLSKGSYWAQFKNPNLPVERQNAPCAAAIEAALTLPIGSVDTGAHKVRRVGAGVDFIYARARLDVVRAATLHHTNFEVLAIEGVVGVLLYAEGGNAPDADYHVRMFAPGADVDEDAATGSAAAGLPGQIAASSSLGTGSHEWVIEQGVEMGRPSRIEVIVETNNDHVTDVQIGGHAVPVMRGEITV